MNSPSHPTNPDGSIDDFPHPSIGAMDDLMSDIAYAPSNEEEEDSKDEVALALWSHLTEAGRRAAWSDLHDIRKKARAWAVKAANPIAKPKSINDMKTQNKSLAGGQEALIASLAGRSAESTMVDLFGQVKTAEGARNLALALVGATLCHKDQLASRQLVSDETVELLQPQSSGDFRIKNCVFVVHFDLPSEELFNKIEQILGQREIEIWLLTSGDRVASLKYEFSKLFGKRMVCIVVTSVESFVGQNITELAGFSSIAKVERITELIDLYNHKWVEAVGAPSIRISIE